MPVTNSTETIHNSSSVINKTGAASRAGSPVQPDKKLSGIDTFESKGKAISAAPSKFAGIKRTCKVVGGTVVGAGLLAFAGFGMYAAGPHIAALFGVIAAAPATVPILITVGAVLGTVALTMVIVAVYRKVKKEQLRNANIAAVKAEAQQSLSNPAQSTMPTVDVKKLGQAINEREQDKLDLADACAFRDQAQKWLQDPAYANQDEIDETEKNLQTSLTTIAQLERKLAVA